MPSPWVIIYGSLLIIQVLPSHGLPIIESPIFTSGPTRKAINASIPESAPSSLSHSQLMNKGKPPIDIEDSENPSLLTSIPTFAPPPAIRRRGDDRQNVGINIPIPTISVGIPSVRVIRKHISNYLRKMLKRSPTAQSTQPLPPAPTNAMRPHKAPITDSTVNFVKDAEQYKSSDSTDQLDNKAGVDETDSDTTANNTIGRASGDLADSPSNVIQDIASQGTTPGTPPQPEVEGAIGSGSPKPHSLSESLGTLSHAQWVEEDNGKKRRKRDNDKYKKDARKRAPDLDDGGIFGQTLDDYEVPTIWNGEVDLDDLNWYELQELDDWLDTLAYVQEHKKAPPRISSSTARPAINSNTSAFNDSSTFPPTIKSSMLAPPPKSLAKALGLKSHSSLHNKTHRGNRRDETSRHSVGRGMTRLLVDSRSPEKLQIPPAQDEKLNRKREDADDPKLDTIDISDEAFNEFRKNNPTFFRGWRQKDRRANAISNAEFSVKKRDPLSPSWFAMLLSPSALLEKRPASKQSSSEKRDDMQQIHIEENYI